MSFSEVLIIAVIAVLVLGPEKLPDTMIQIAKFFKMLKKGVNDAKSTFDQEMKIAELKEDAKKYRENLEKTTENVRKKLTFEELDALKSGVNDITGGLNDAVSGVKKAVDSVKNPTEAIKDAVLGSGESPKQDTQSQNSIKTENKNIENQNKEA
ncbi:MULTISPECIES: Sec-independent protein translocase protein TatB [unclassified Campylobacter]|nr:MULTISPECIES: Sec-independent protein translocase protein TatB [unclassified Campylobacter]